MDDMEADLHARGIDVYDEQITDLRALIGKTAREAAPADQAVSVVFHVSTAKRPKTRYLAGKDAKAVGLMAKVLPDRLKDRVVVREASLPDRE